MKYDDEGRELPDPTPMAIPAGMRRPESLIDTMRRLIRTEFSKDVGAIGYETFEEANDFDVEEDDAEIRESQYERMQDEQPGLPGAGGGSARGTRPGTQPGRSESDPDDDEGEDEPPARRGRSAAQNAAEDEDPAEGRRSGGRKPQQRPNREAARPGGRQRPTSPRLGPGDDEEDDFDDE